MKSPLLAIIASVALALGVAGIAIASIPSSDNTIHGCYTKIGGVLRVIDTEKSPPERCTRFEVPISWNQQGPPGPKGDKGDPGPAGPPSGPAGGDLTGNYPNPTIADGAVGAGQVLDGSLGTSKFSNSIPAVRVTNSGIESIPSGPSPALAFDTEQYDTANMHDNSTNNSRLTAPVTGIYLVTGHAQWQPAAGGTRIATILVNGATGLAADGAWAVTGSGSEHTNPTTVVRLQAGEYVELTVFQTSGGNVNIVPSTDLEFSMTWLAPGP